MSHHHFPHNPWKRHSYPCQSCTERASKPRQDSVITLTESHSSEEGPTKYPSTIRATKSAETPVRGRTIVICLDGTGDSFDNDNSNVVNFVACLKKDDPSQITYYQSGIGTYDGHGLKNGISAAVDMAVGSGLGIHVKDAYRFLMQNYKEGDRICLLGFSRGAYTVRCLTGMLHKVGLLPAHNRQQIQFAYEFFKNDTKEGWDMSREFKRTFCTNVSVYFVGVWDCVASVGFIPRKLPFSKSPTNSIAYFRHAMALDEHRAKFKICQWQQQNPAAKHQHLPHIDQIGKSTVTLKRIITSCFGAGSKPERESSKPRKPSLFRSKKEKEEEEKTETREDAIASEEECHLSHKPKTDVKEVWFAGAHADVGGGAELNKERHMLSRIPLRWMIRQCFECETGIIFSTAALAETGLDVPSLWPTYQDLGHPVVGPSPAAMECKQKGELPPIRRRSTALGVIDEKRKDKVSKNSNDEPISHHFEPEKEDHHQRSSSKSSTEKFNPDFDLLPEHVEDHFDAACKVNDQLAIAKGWWILEFWPVKVRVQKKDAPTGEWTKVVAFNMGRYRAIRELEPVMHWTVKARLEDGASEYKIQNRLDKDAVWKVDR